MSEPPRTTFGAPTLLKNGSGNYSIVAGGRNRWGDYSAISVDPNNPDAFWIAEEDAIPGAGSFLELRIRDDERAEDAVAVRVDPRL